MSDERPNRRYSILKNPEDMSDMNKTKGGGMSRRVSFHNLRTVQQYEPDHGHFRHDPEFLSMSSISSGDELTKHAQHSNQARVPLANLNQQEERMPLVEKKKSRQSLGDKKKRQSMGEDTRCLFANPNDSMNLTAQFGARQAGNDTLLDDNTQALFGMAQQTCTEAFFVGIRQNHPVDSRPVSVQNKDLTVSNEMTEDFLESIKPQQAHQSQQTPKPVHTDQTQSQGMDDSMAGFLSPRTLHQQLDQTVPKSAAPMRDETVLQQPEQNTESPANQTFAASFQPEISSYVLRDNSDENSLDNGKSLRDGTNQFHPPTQQQQRDQPSFEFEDTLKNLSVADEPMQIVRDEEVIMSNGDEVMIQSTHFEISNLAREDRELAGELSHHITLYEDDNVLDGLEQKKAMGETQDVLLEDSNVLASRIIPNDDKTIQIDDTSTVQLQHNGDSQPSIVNRLSKTYAVAPRSPNLTYVVPTPVVKSKPSINDDDTTSITIMNDTVLSSGSDQVNRKLNETREKLLVAEEKLKSRRSSVNFSQILTEAKLNRSIAMSPVKESPVKESHVSSHPPLKQARMFNSSVDSPRYSIQSVAVPTTLLPTPQANTRKSHHKPASALKALSASRSSRQVDTTRMSSTPTRQVRETPILRNMVPQSMSSRKIVPSSVLKAVTTPTLNNRENNVVVELNPMHGPVQLKSIEDIKWAKQLAYDPNWLNATRVPKWNPLPDNYLDHHGSTAGLEKDELHRKAETIVVRAINKCEGDMDQVKKYLYELNALNNEQVKPYKDRMLELKAKHDALVEHYNTRVAFYNQLIATLRDKRHAENEKFISNIKAKIQAVMKEWTAE